MSEGGATGEEGFIARTRRVESAGLYDITISLALAEPLRH